MIERKIIFVFVSFKENEAKACIYRAIDWPSSVNASYGQKLQKSYSNPQGIF